MPETAGRFHLNAELSIPFNGSSCMEVDLLRAEARLVIELGGAQHLDSFEAYCRDHRKDMVFQQHHNGPKPDGDYAWLALERRQFPGKTEDQGTQS